MLNAAVALGLLTAALSAPVASAAAGDVERVSVATSGAQGHGDSTAPSVSHQGDVVAFQSPASTLVGGDGNGLSDVCSSRGVIRRLTEGTGGTEADGVSDHPALSSDGRFVAFRSKAARG